MGNAPANGNGNGAGNGHGPLRLPVRDNSYRALSDLAGARVKTVESVSFNARSLDEVLKTIRNLGSTGSLSMRSTRNVPRPWRCSTIPSRTSADSASRTEGLPMSRSAARLRSVGNLSPGCSLPSLRSETI